MLNYDLDELVTASIARSKNSLFTALPARILSYDPATRTCSAQPTIGVDSETVEMTPARIDGVPVHFCSGGGAVMTFPVKQGDTCLLIFSMLPLEDWIDSAGTNITYTNGGRTHDVTDAFALVGFGTKRVGAADPDHVVIQFGSSKITIKSDGNTIIEGKLHVTNGITTDKSIVARESITATTGNISAPSGDITAGTVSMKNHVHRYYWTDGAGNDSTQKATQ